MVTYPEDWKAKQLKDIGYIQMCRRIFQDQTKKSGQIPFYKIGTFGSNADAYISRELFEQFRNMYPYPAKGDVLLSAAGTIGKIVVFDGRESYFQDSNIVWLKVDESEIDKRFLYYFYKSFPWKALEGTTIGRLYNNIILNTDIHLASLPEQQAIASVLSDFDEYIDNLTELIEKKKAIREGALEDLVSGKTRVDGFSGEWESQTINDFIKINRGASPRPIESYLTNNSNGISWIKIGDAPRYGKYIESTKERITSSGANHSVMVFPDDFLLSNSMSFGRPYILKVKGCIHDGWLRLYDFHEKADKDFLFHLLSAKNVQTQYIEAAAGSGVQNLNKQVVMGVKVVLPSLPEQQAIASVLTAMDEELESLETEKTKMMGVKEGAMNDLLTGRVRLKL